MRDILLQTVEQLKAARAMVSMTRDDLVLAVLENGGDISAPTIKRIEQGSGQLSGRSATIQMLQSALEASGVEFIPENGGGAGVRLRK